MKKYIEEKDNNIVQITIADERWYVKSDEEGNRLFVPSVTWITSFYPKGKGFEMWLKKMGEDADEVKMAAAEKGSRIHKACVDLIDGKTVKMDSVYTDDEGEDKELTLEEFEAVMSFVDFCKEYKPEFIDREFVVWSDEHNYAGTVDILCEIGGIPYIIDLKSSQGVYSSHIIQVSAYKNAFMEGLVVEGEDDPLEINLAILQLGYRKNKKRFKFNEIDDQFDLFLSARNIWENETKGIEPFKKDYPYELSIMPKKDGDTRNS